MAYNEKANVGVLFGGRGASDGATGLTHASAETWLWTSNQWIQQMPANHPPARSSHTMTYDSKRGRVLLFSGRKEATVPLAVWTYFNDTWAWENGDWRQLSTSTVPPAREYASMAYDADRDRVVMFGGFNFKADGRTTQAIYDTWEFDGENWAQVQASGPEVAKPILFFDAARHETIMLGIDSTSKTLMYRWIPASSSWQSITPTTLPACVNEASGAYQSHNERIVVTGGVCSAQTSELDETWEWDGTNWTKLVTTVSRRFIGAAIAYDPAEKQLVRFGGTGAFAGRPDSSTYVLNDLRWTFNGSTTNPLPRSLPVLRRDPVRNHLWLMGGLSEFSSDQAFYIDDFWRFQGGEWYREVSGGIMPVQCATPLSAFDTDRSVMVVVCGDGTVGEWDGAAWKHFDAEDGPDSRRFAALAYDETLKKTILFGGFDSVNYRDDTWSWNGTAWSKIETDDEPEHRAQMTMWYDPLAKKTILFSGAGRPNLDARVTRFSDMWSFNGTTWTKMSVTTTPGIRMGSQTAVDPRNGKVLLFGGLRATVDGRNVDQFYGNDLWMWDGAASTWTAVQTPFSPPARQNVGFDFDPSLNKFVLYGGYMGNFYLSDLWTFDGEQWEAIQDRPRSARRRGTRQ